MKRFIKVLSIINIIVLSFTLSSCTNATKLKEKHESFKNLQQDDKINKMKEEVEYMCEKLEKKHKNLYHTISKEEFKAREEKLINELPSIENETDYYFALTELISSLKDAHTRVKDNMLIEKDTKFYKFNIEKFDDSWVLTGIDEDNQDKLGYKVKAINNVDINEIFNRTLEVYPHENSYVLINSFSNYAKIGQLLKRIKVIDDISENISLTLEDEKENEEVLNVPLGNYDESSHLCLLSNQVKLMDTEYLQDIYYWSKKLNDETYYIQYNVCAEDDSLKMSDFKKIIASDIKDNNFKKVIIDLRYNGGGNSRIIEPLYDELSKLKADLKFQVYILIGNRTFSSALLNAYDGSKQLGATLVGEPTGGNLNHYGEVKTFNLPYSGFTITYCTKYFENVKGYDKDALYPDIKSSIKLDDYINGVDTVVQTVIDN